eukprot:4514383-Prymnesium_polylepis.1
MADDPPASQATLSTCSRWPTTSGSIRCTPNMAGLAPKRQSPPLIKHAPPLIRHAPPLIWQLLEYNWLDRGTSALAVKLNFRSENDAVACRFQILFEFTGACSQPPDE